MPSNCVLFLLYLFRWVISSFTSILAEVFNQSCFPKPTSRRWAELTDPTGGRHVMCPRIQFKYGEISSYKLSNPIITPSLVKVLLIALYYSRQDLPICQHVDMSNELLDFFARHVERRIFFPGDCGRGFAAGFCGKGEGSFRMKFLVKNSQDPWGRTPNF